MIQTDKILCVFDLETTGVNIASDRIVQFAAHVILPDGSSRDYNMLINPGVPIPPGATEVHHITDEMVKDAPLFEDVADEIFDIVNGAVLVGYNLLNFDIPLLAEELLRADLSMPECSVIDAGNIFKKKEERTLSAAVKFYCGREMEGAHDALNDVHATRDILFAQLERYPDLPKTVEELHEFSRFGDKRVDFAGKFAYDADGDVIYTFGKDSKGKKVKLDTGLCRWMLDKDFTRDTKSHAERLLEEFEVKHF